ncbi:hypothetical protein NL676_031046 [Syzygium grande]|nr:hypothetical protein NL676_031046 [Syzygium grande]
MDHFARLFIGKNKSLKSRSKDKARGERFHRNASTFRASEEQRALGIGATRPAAHTHRIHLARTDDPTRPSARLSDSIAARRSYLQNYREEVVVVFLLLQVTQNELLFLLLVRPVALTDTAKARSASKIRPPQQHVFFFFFFVFNRSSDPPPPRSSSSDAVGMQSEPPI